MALNPLVPKTRRTQKKKKVIHKKKLVVDEGRPDISTIYKLGTLAPSRGKALPFVPVLRLIAWIRKFCLDLDPDCEYLFRI